jgi:hypothetical protein
MQRIIAGRIKSLLRVPIYTDTKKHKLNKTRVLKMDFKAEDFPLYQHIVQLGKASAEAQKAFSVACSGGDAEKYEFAFGIQTVAVAVPLGQISGVTKEMNDKTLRSCLAIFQEVANGTSTIAAEARQMVDYFASNKLGL